MSRECNETDRKQKVRYCSLYYIEPTVLNYL